MLRPENPIDTFDLTVTYNKVLELIELFFNYLLLILKCGIAFDEFGDGDTT